MQSPGMFYNNAPMWNNPYQGPLNANQIMGFHAIMQSIQAIPAPPTESTLDCGDGYVIDQIAYVHLKNGVVPEQAKSMINARQATWSVKDENGKDTGEIAVQRTVRACTDQLVLYAQSTGYNTTMNPNRDVCLVLGRWDKPYKDYLGNTTKLKGLVLAGGGHYESTGQRSVTKSYTGERFKLEPGDIDWWNSANKELAEEAGVNLQMLRQTIPLAIYDDPLKDDPRFPSVSLVFARFTEQAAPSKELSRLVLVPLSQLGNLINPNMPGSIMVDGEPLRIILGHDRLIRHMLQLPTMQQFIAKIKAACQITTPPVQVPPLQPVYQQTGMPMYGQQMMGSSVQVL